MDITDLQRIRGFVIPRHWLRRQLLKRIAFQEVAVVFDGLDEGGTVITMFEAPSYNGTILVVWHKDFPVLPDGAEIPLFDGTITFETIPDAEDGRGESSVKLLDNPDERRAKCFFIPHSELLNILLGKINIDYALLSDGHVLMDIVPCNRRNGWLLLINNKTFPVVDPWVMVDVVTPDMSEYLEDLKVIYETK